MNPDRQARDDGAVKLLAHLFGRMCDEDDEIATAGDRRAVSAAYFLGWLQKTIDFVNGVELCAELGVPQASWDFVQTVAHTGNMQPVRSEERRVGKECRRGCGSRWATDHYKEKGKRGPGHQGQRR